MTYDYILELLSHFNLIAWVIAAISALFILRATQNKGWVLIMFGSLFVVMRQLWKLFPDYELTQESTVLFNTYMMRYVLGATGAILLCIGFIVLIVSYYVMKEKIGQD